MHLDQNRSINSMLNLKVDNDKFVYDANAR